MANTIAKTIANINDNSIANSIDKIIASSIVNGKPLYSLATCTVNGISNAWLKV
jgi:hypothetical protein